MKKLMVLTMAAFAAMMPLIANEETAVVTFDANGGMVDCWDEWGKYYTGSETSWTVTKGTAICNLPYICYDGDDHFFTGWFDVNGNEFTEDSIVTNDMTVTARWIVDDGSFKMLVSRGTVKGYFGTCPTELTAADWPEGVTAIGDSAFYNASQLESVSIPAGVTNIGYQAFASCYSLTNATIPALVEAIDDYAFARSSLATVTFVGGAENIATLSDYAFWDTPYDRSLPFSMIVDEAGIVTGYHGTCPATLATADWPVGVTEIGNSAFNSAALTSVVIPSTVTAIGAYAFSDCFYLTTVNFLGAESNVDIAATAFIRTPYDAGKLFGLIVDDSSSTLVGLHGVAPANVVISNCLESVDLAGIGSLALSAWYYGTSSVTNVVVPEGVTWIDSYAFAADEALESVTLPESLQSISYNAFYYCTALRELRIPSGVEYVDYTLFEGCTNLTVYAPATLRGAFSVPEGCTIEYYEVPQYTVTFDANGGTVNGGATTNCLIYAGRMLGVEGYDEWENWGRWLPTPTQDGYEFLGWFTAAEGGTQVTAETVVTGAMTLYAHWEKRNDDLSDAREITSDVGTLRVSNREATAEEEEATLHHSNKTIWYKWIAPTNGIMTVDTLGSYFDTILAAYTGTEGATLSELSQLVFNDTGPGFSYSESQISFTATQGTTYYIVVGGWSNASGDITLNWDFFSGTFELKVVDGVVTGYRGTCPTTLTVEDWPDGVTEIGVSAFYNASQLESVSIPAGVTNIGYRAFAYCYSLTNATIPASVEAIDDYAFQCCSCLSSVTFNGDVSQMDIADSAFDGTPWAQDNMPTVLMRCDEYGNETENGTTLGGYHGADPVTLDIPADVTVIRDWAFNGCNTLQELTIPTNVTEMGNYAFGNCGNLLRAYLPKALEGVIDEESVFGGSPVTVYYYEGTEPTFATVTLDPGEGSVYMGTVRVILGNAIGTLPTPTREGFDFAGWFDGDGKRVSSGFVVTSDVTLTAYWLEVSPWYWYDNGDGVVISGARDYSVVTNGVLTIPATLTVLDDDGEMVALPVVGIDSYAFESWSFSVLMLPASIEWIGRYAFSCCRSLTTVTFSGDMDEIDMGNGVHTVFYATPWLDSHPFTFVTAEENGEVYLTGCYGSPVPTETLQLSNDVTVVRAYALPWPEWPGEGYCRFLGWYTAAEGGERVGGDEDVAVTGGPVLYARWEAVTPEWYFYITEEDEAFITGNSVSLKGDIVIPASITVEDVTYPVTAIGEDAFYGMDGIESVTIPASVTNIYGRAFGDCSGLTNVVFAGGMASVQVTLASAFYGTPWLLAYRSLLPVPGNDDRENAETIFGTFGSVAGTTFNSSRETVDLIPDEYDRECPSTVWYRWTAPTNGTFVFHVTDANPASDLSSVVGVTTGYNAEEGCWTNVVTRWGAVAVRAVEGVEYWIEVGSYCVAEYIEEQDFVLSWGPAPDNDEYENAQELASTESGNVNGTLLGATIANNDCIWQYGDAERTVWYKWVAPFTGNVQFAATADNGQNDLLYLVATHGYDEDEEEWDDCGYDYGNMVVFGVEEGETYYVSLATWNYVVSGFTLSWQRLLPPDNDNFADATMITGTSGSVTGTNLGASVEDDDPLSLEFDSTATVWWRWTAPTNGTFAFSTQGSDFDTVLGVYTGTAVAALVRVAVNDDCGEGGDRTSAVTFDAVMGTNYYIAVGGYRTNKGNIVLSWGVDDDVDDVIVDAGGGKTVAVPGSWLEEYDTLWDDYNGDKTAYANSTAVNGRKVWECYVLGLNPEEDDDFTIVSFPMNADGTPDLDNIEFYPPQDDWNVPAQPVVKGAAALGGAWQTVTEQNKTSLRFFKVVVELP